MRKVRRLAGFLAFGTAILAPGAPGAAPPDLGSAPGSLWGMRLSPGATSILAGSSSAGVDSLGVLELKDMRWTDLLSYGQGWGYQPLGWGKDDSTVIARKFPLGGGWNYSVMLLEQPAGKVTWSAPGSQAWESPDGVHIILQQDSVVLLVSLDGGRETELADMDRPPNLATPPSALGAWAPDGSRLSFSQWKDSYGALVLAGAPDWKPRTLMQGDPMERFVTAWSPDSRSLAVLQLSVLHGRQSRLLLLDPESGQSRTLWERPTLSPEVPPLWSSDGRSMVSLVVQQTDPLTGSGDPIPTLCRVESGELLPLSDQPVKQGYLAWGPDGDELWLVQTDAVVAFPLPP